MRKGYEWLLLGVGLSMGVMLGAFCLLVGFTLQRPVDMVFFVVFGYGLITVWYAIFLTAEDLRIERRKWTA